MFIFLGEGTFTRHYTHFLSDLSYRVCTRLSSSNSMTFRDIFNDLFEVFMTLGLAVTFKTFFFFRALFNILNSTETNISVHQNGCHF